MISRVASERRFPQCVTQDEHAVAAGNVFAGPQPSADLGSGAECFDQPGGYERSGQAGRFAFAGERERVSLRVGRSVERANLFTHRRKAAIRIRARDAHEPIRRRIRKARQQHAVDETEDRRVCTAAESEREDGDRSEAWIPAEHTGGIADVLRYGLDHGHSPRIPALFLRQVHASEPADDDAARFECVDTRGDQVVHLPIQMETDFIVEVPLHIRAAKQGTHAQWDGVAPAADGSQQASHDLRLVEIDDVGDGGREAAPALTFALQLLAAQAAERVELRATVVLGGPPGGGEPAFLLESVKRGIELFVADLQDVAGYLLEPLADAVAVHRLQREDFEEQQVEGALYEVSRSCHGVMGASLPASCEVRSEPCAVRRVPCVVCRAPCVVPVRRAPNAPSVTELSIARLRSVIKGSAGYRPRPRRSCRFGAPGFV